jgi:hypothetical protein
MRVRSAKAQDRAVFRRLWAKKLEEDVECGASFFAASEANLEIFSGIFDSYIEDPRLGVVLLIGEDAVLMWGLATSYADLTLERPATGWGVYVSPELKDTKATRMLTDEGHSRLAALGFTDVILTRPARGEGQHVVAVHLLEKKDDQPPSTESKRV